MGISVSMMDVSEQKHAETAQRELDAMRERVAELEAEMAGIRLGAMTLRSEWKPAVMAAD